MSLIRTAGLDSLGRTSKGTEFLAKPRNSVARDNASGGLDAFPTIAVVGATGAVGAEAMSILAARGVDAGRVRLLGSARSAGSRLAYGGGTLPVIAAGPREFEGVDLALFCASAEVARELVPRALEAGATVVDNSSAFRTDPRVPLVTPEVNGSELTATTRLVANPNCSTIILLVALEPLRRAFGVEEVVVSTYQAVSGAGAEAMAELADQARAFADGRTSEPRVFREPCLFNVFSHDSAVDPETGINGEELKLINESRRIWNLPALRVSPTCIRVPTMRAHAESIRVTLGVAAMEAEVREALETGAGLRIIDERIENRFPTPLKAAGADDVLIGRLRPDPGSEVDAAGRTDRWLLWVCADQIRKGAALNAIQIAELIGKRRSNGEPRQEP